MGGAVERVLERAVVQSRGGEVEQRSRGRGDRQPPQGRDLVGRKDVRAVDDDAGPARVAAASTHRDVDQPRVAPAEPESVCGAVVAQERVIAERQHSRPAPSFATNAGMSDGVDATMQLM
jgi:hypothetical protein